MVAQLPAIRRDIATLAARLARDVSAGRALAPPQVAEAIGRDLDPWQGRVLATGADQVLLNCSRQAGKTEVTAIVAAARLQHPGTRVLCLSPTLRQSALLYARIRRVLGRMGGAAPSQVAASAQRVDFANGSDLWCLPGSEANVRGFDAVDLLLIDEAARVDDALYEAVRPMLAVSGGSIWLLSTPHGRRGFFYREWTEGRGWHRETVTADQCPRIDSVWLERERARLGGYWYRQEYGGEFVQAEDSFFPADAIDRAFIDTDEPPWFAQGDDHGAADPGADAPWFGQGWI